MKQHLLVPPTGKGYKGVERKVGTIVQASLMSQLYDFDLVIERNDTKKAMMWAKEEDIARVEACPVLLAHALEEEHDTSHVYLLGPLPLPYHGSYALIKDAEGENLIIHEIRSLPESAQELQRQIYQKIIDLASLAQPEDINHIWVNATPLHQSVADEATYQLFQQQTISKILQTSDPKKQAELDQQLSKIMLFHRHILMIDRLLQVSDYPARFQEIARMMQELATAYYDHHLTQAQDKRNLPTISDAFINGKASIWTALPFQAYPEAISNAVSGAKRWSEEQMTETDYRVTYTKTSPAGTTTIHMESLHMVTPEEKNAAIARERVWQQVRQMGDLDSDVYIAFVAQLVNSIHTRDKGGYTWINATNILEYRGIKPKTEKTPSGKVYSAGQRYEDLEKIATCVRRMRFVRVTVDQVIYEEPTPGKKGKNKGKPKTVRYRRESPLFVFADSITRQELWSYANGGHPTTEVAWQIRESAWMEPFIQGTNRMEGTILQSCLEYDPHNEMWEKRLSKYLMIHLLMNKHSASITRNINGVLEELSLSEEIDTRYPQRIKDRFEKALNRLKADGHISGWQYKEPVELPARKWLDTWMAQGVVFHKPIIIDGSSTPGVLPSGKP